MFDPEFYPTPRSVALRMLDKLAGYPVHFLEPSAGKGDLAQAIKDRFHRAEVDCIEASPDLAAILSDKGFPVVGFDWLDYPGVSYYDAILMNPPYSKGDEHLLRAWDFLHQGQIVCLLNAETLRNPHTAGRQRLAGIVAQHGSVEMLGDCFRDAERRTGVEVAMVHLTKVAEDDSLDLWSLDKAEREARGDIEVDSVPALIDRLGNREHYYNAAVEHMLQAFGHIRRAAQQMRANGYSVDLNKILPLAAENITHARAEFLKQNRRHAWASVFEATEFRKWLDRKQTDAMVRDIERNANIPFTADNIRGTLQNVLLQRGRLFEQSVWNVFDTLTRFYPGNTSHTEGWKSNSGYKVNEKLVFPYGCSYDKTFSSFNIYRGSGYTQVDIYDDLDRILCVLDHKDFDQCRTIGTAMREAFRTFRETGETQCESAYFTIRFFKKGTVHLRFKDRLLWAKFNVTAAKGKAWVGEDRKAA